MTKRKRNFFLSVIATAAVVLLFLAFTITPPKQKPTEPQEILMPYNLSFTLPAGWTVFKKPLVNQYVFVNGQNGDSACYLDVFAVRPDRDYSFARWLGTALGNQTFLQTGKETTYKGKNMYIGNYNFVDDYFKEPVNNQRAILKGGGTLVDMHMSYKANSSCTKNFQQVLDSVNF